jgi:hypothetical protein
LFVVRFRRGPRQRRILQSIMCSKSLDFSG